MAVLSFWGIWSQRQNKNVTLKQHILCMLFGEATMMLYLSPGNDIWVGGEPNQGKTQQLHLCHLRTTESGKNGNVMIWERWHIW